MHELVTLTQDLIRYKSVHSRPDEILSCASFIEAYLTRHGVGYRRIEQNGVPTILVLRPDGTAPVLLMSHIDVVDAPDELFEPRVENGKLFGRGSIDDKYAAALSVVLVREHLERLRAAGKSQADLPFGLLISGDEEIGGKNGARTALSQLKTDFAIALDGGNLKKIVVKEKGILRLKLVAHGKNAHGARPWLGENAIENLIADFFKLKAHFEVTAPNHWHRTLNFSRIQAGKAANQVPDYAEALFDIRYTENDDMDAVVAAIRSSIRGQLEIVEREPLFQGGDTPHLARLIAIAGSPEVGCEHGASDARFLSEFGIPGIVWGPDGDNSAHSPQEHVNIDTLLALHTILDEFLTGGL
ncbi:MAG: M20/M25/M40 family metallo-hydrolase [Desulfobacterales bacterium]